jgi:uncharacterized membrane protein
MRMRDSHRTIILKSLSYTAAVVVADAAIVQLITHKTDQTIMVLVTTNLGSLAIYYIHAHIWNTVRPVRKKSR